MEPLTMWKRLVLWWWRMRSHFCEHEFEEDLSVEVREGWGQSTCPAFCRKCGAGWVCTIKLRVSGGE